MEENKKITYRGVEMSFCTYFDKELFYYKFDIGGNSYEKYFGEACDTIDKHLDKEPEYEPEIVRFEKLIGKTVYAVASNIVEYDVLEETGFRRYKVGDLSFDLYDVEFYKVIVRESFIQRGAIPLMEELITQQEHVEELRTEITELQNEFIHSTDVAQSLFNDFKSKVFSNDKSK